MADARILIVEDDGIEALDLQHWLTSLGYTAPDIVTTGEEAVIKAEEVQPDLILMDIMLSGEIDGVTAAEQIHARFDIPVIFLTAYADEKTLRRAKATEPYGYLTKPYKEKDLDISIDMALYKHTMEKKLKESEKWFATTLSSIGDAVITTDKNGLITFINPVAGELTGWNMKNALNKNVSEVFNIINMDTRKPVENSIARVLHEGVTAGPVNPTILIARDGTEMPIDNNAAPITTERGNIIGVVLVFRDISERKRVEDKLREKEELLSLTGRIAKIGSWEFDARTLKGTWTDEVARIHDMDPTQKTNVELGISFYHGASRKAIESAIKEALESGMHYDLELELITARGTHKWVRTIGRPLTEEGRVVKVQGTFQDITELKKSEGALRESEERFRLLVEGVKDYAIIMLDPAGNVMSWNQGAERIKGYRDGEIVGRHFSCFYTAEDVQQGTPQRELEKALKNGRSEAEGWRIRKDGSRFWADVVVTALHAQDGRLRGFAKITRDVTERRRAEEELRAREEFIRIVLDNLPIGIAVNFVDPAVQFDYMNDNFARFYRTTREKLAEPDAFWDAVYEDPAFREEMKTTVLEDCASGDPERMSWTDVPITRGGTETRFISAKNIPLPDKKLLISAVWDVTERKMAEDQIKKLNAELEQRVKDRTVQLEATNKELESFSYSVSHDLRAPLRHLTGFVELLNKRATTLDEKSRHYLEVITGAASQMGRLVDDLLSFSRMGRSEMMRSQVDLRALLDEAIHDLRTDTMGRNIQWDIKALPKVSGDPAMLKLVFVNLLSNALKFSRPREQVVIEIGCDQGNGGETIVHVKDNGVGFDMKYVDKLFNLFQRLHRPEEFEGTGVGLANVQRIIHRHGGRTWAKGGLGEGATVFFSLPDIKGG